MQNPTTRKSPPLFGGKRLSPSRTSLKKLLHHFGVELLPETLDQLWSFHQLLRENNEDQDLTRLNAFETMVARHYADCTIINAFEQSWTSPMLDVGSGAGFPGIPLKLVNPNINITLCEPRPRRVEFLELVIKELGLKNIAVFPHKVTSRSMTIPVSGVITRAFESIVDTLPRLQSCLQTNGRVWFMKGPAVRQELEDFNFPGYQVLSQRFYDIPHTKEKRALVVLQRNGKVVPLKG